MMSGGEERVSKRARRNYPGEVCFGALSKKEDEHSVAQVSRCICAWTEDDTKPQFLGGLGEEVSRRGDRRRLQEVCSIRQKKSLFIFCWASHTFV